MNCHACGREIPLATGERIAFRDECEGCGADLHACRGCAHYDPAVYNACREPMAERVSDPERANRCDHFTPAARAAGGGTEDIRSEARSKLEELFKK